MFSFFFKSQSKEGSILFDSDLAEITQTQVILKFWPSFYSHLLCEIRLLRLL